MLSAKWQLFCLSLNELRTDLEITFSNDVSAWLGGYCICLLGAENNVEHNLSFQNFDAWSNIGNSLTL